MSNVARSAERLIGLFAYFVELGATVDTQTISSTVFPDASPTSNWPSIGTILPGAAWGVDEEDDSYLAPALTGGFRKVDRMNVIQDFLTFQTRQMSAIVDRLQHGLAGAIVEGTAQTPFASSDRYIRGWLLIQGRQVGGNGTGTDDFRMMIWCDLRLGEQPKYDNKVLSPTLKAIVIPNALNSDLFPAAA
jgi:hypothetical protein